MKNKVQSNSKVVLFPKLKWRIKTETLDAIENKNYTQAIKLLHEMETLFGEIEDRELTVGYVICLLEIGKLDEAKEKCKKLLQVGIGDYYDLLQIYLSILIQLHEYVEVVATIEAVLEEDRIPSDRAEHLFQLLDFSRKRLEVGNDIGITNQQEEIYNNNDEEKLEMLLVNKDYLTQVNILKEISLLPIYILLPYFKKALTSATIHPLTKTMILQHLVLAEVEESVEVNKFGQTKDIVPSHLKNILEEPISISILNKLDDELGNENPTLYEVVKQIWEQYLFIIFPFQPIANENIWAAALHLTGYDLHGIEISIDEICNRYSVDEEDVLFVREDIQEKEQTFLVDN